MRLTLKQDHASYTYTISTLAVDGTPFEVVVTGEALERSPHALGAMSVRLVDTVVAYNNEREARTAQARAREKLVRFGERYSRDMAQARREQRPWDYTTNGGCW